MNDYPHRLERQPRHPSWNNTLDKLRGITQRGNDVITTIDAKAQRTAQDALAGHCGGAVAPRPDRQGRCSSGPRSRP